MMDRDREEDYCADCGNRFDVDEMSVLDGALVCDECYAEFYRREEEQKREERRGNDYNNHSSYSHKESKSPRYHHYNNSKQVRTPVGGKSTTTNEGGEVLGCFIILGVAIGIGVLLYKFLF